MANFQRLAKKFAEIVLFSDKESFEEKLERLNSYKDFRRPSAIH